MARATTRPTSWDTLSQRALALPLAQRHLDLTMRLAEVAVFYLQLAIVSERHG